MQLNHLNVPVSDTKGVGSFYGKITSLDKKLVLPKETQIMMRDMVARINICLLCIDIGRWHATKTLVNEEKLNALPDYATSPYFSKKERAALDYVCELTRNKQVNPETFNQLSKFYTEREICEIVYLVASEHVYTITNLGLNIHSDMLCQLKQNVSIQIMANHD